MILDIRYRGTHGPEQIQQVRMTTVYPHKDGTAGSELVIHFYYDRPQLNIPMKDIRSITVTND